MTNEKVSFLEPLLFRLQIFYSSLSIYYMTAPTSRPQGLQCTALSDKAIEFQWKEPEKKSSDVTNLNYQIELRKHPDILGRF